MPEDFTVGSADNLGKRRIIPSTSVDQYAATLAKWFGLSENEVNAIFPNVSRFEQPYLNFMLLS